MRISWTLLSFVFLAFVAVESSAESTSTLKIETSNSAKLEDLQKPEEKKKDIDAEITDARLRAQLGSRSVWSFKSHFTYAGAAVNDPFNGIRPNYRLSAKMEEMTSLSGMIGLNYRISERDSLSGGTGITMMDPMHGDLTKSVDDTRKNRSGERTRYEVANPYLSWNRGYRIADMQMISGLLVSQITGRDAVDLFKTSATAGTMHTLIKPLGHSGWSTGFNLMLLKIFYSGEIQDPMIKAAAKMGALKRPDWMLNLSPTLDYQFNDRYSFRTIFGYFQFTQYEDEKSFGQGEPFQSIGTGISITRDIYLYPNIEFTPKDIRADRTNVALTANINLF